MSEKNENRKKGGAHLAKKEKKPKKEKRKRTLQEKIRLAIIVVLIVVLSLAALALIAYAAYRSWAKAPVLPNEVPAVSDGGGTGSGGKKDVPGVEVGGDRKKDFYTFLVIGRDTGGGGNTDTILLAAYDVPNQKLNVMSIPRDTMVNVNWDLKRINSVYNMYGGGEKGIDALYTEVSQLVGFVPDFEVVVEWKAVGELVDAIGGVWFDVPRYMNYWDPTQNLRIQVNKGYQKLDGGQAMGVVRWRQNNDGTGYVTGDIGRIETQQAFLKAVVEQCLQIENVTKIQEFARIFTENVDTDLTVGNLVWFAEQAIFGGLEMENVNFITMPGNYNGYAWSRTYSNNQSYVLPYGDELLTVVNESFNPYLKDRTADQQDIMSVNKDGSVSSSTGVVEDAKAARPPVRSTKPAATPEPDPEPSPSDEPPEDPDVTEPPGTSNPPDVSVPPDVSGPPEIIDPPDVSGDPNVTEPPDTSGPPDVTEPPEGTDPRGTGELPPSVDPEPSPQERADEPPSAPPADDPPVIPTPTPFTPPAGAAA